MELVDTMKKLTLDDIRQLQINPQYLDTMAEDICLVEFDPQLVNNKTFVVHTNFIMIEILLALRKDFIDKNMANHLLNKVDALFDSTDVLTMERIIEKLNIEIVQDMLGVPYFHKIAILCDDLYVSY